MNTPILTPPEVVAQVRYTVIAPIVSRPLAFGEQRALIAQQVAQHWYWPDGQERPVHPRTLLRWVAAYRAGGVEALKPASRISRRRDPTPCDGWTRGCWNGRSPYGPKIPTAAPG
jgi:putative transposase